MVFPRQRALLVTNKAAQINFQLGEKSAAFPRKGTGVLSLSLSLLRGLLGVCVFDLGVCDFGLLSGLCSLFASR